MGLFLFHIRCVRWVELIFLRFFCVIFMNCRRVDIESLLWKRMWSSHLLRETFRKQLRCLCKSSLIHSSHTQDDWFHPFLCFLSTSLHFNWALVHVCVIDELFCWTVARRGHSPTACCEHTRCQELDPWVELQINGTEILVLNDLVADLLLLILLLLLLLRKRRELGRREGKQHLLTDRPCWMFSRPLLFNTRTPLKQAALFLVYK